MPTYRLRCKHCYGEFETWVSIHDSLPKRHDINLDPFAEKRCNGELIQVITKVATYGVGNRGAETRDTDARDREVSLNRDAYARLRAEGHQPVSVMGSPGGGTVDPVPSAYECESKATDDWYIRTGGQVSVPDGKREEVNEMLAEGATTSWNPIDAVKAERNS